MTHIYNDECFVVQILDRRSLKEIGYLKTSFHRIYMNEYSANISIVDTVKQATCKKTVGEAWDLAQFVIIHLFCENHYTFRVIEPDKNDVITYIPPIVDSDH